MGVKVGYPDKWRDYSGLDISSQPYVLNVLNSQVLELKYSMNKVRKPVDPVEWPEFYAAFPDIKPGDKLFREAGLRPVIW